jgi:hypothetical protein
MRPNKYGICEADPFPDSDNPCVTAECAAGILENPRYEPETECNIECNVKYQPICTGIGAGVGFFGTKIGGGLAAGSCVLVKVVVCSSICDDDKEGCFDKY